MFAQVFCDFGPAFEVLDVDGAWHICWLGARGQLACVCLCVYGLPSFEVLDMDGM